MRNYSVGLCQHIIVGRDSEIAPTNGLLMVGGNSESRPFQVMNDLYIGRGNPVPTNGSTHHLSIDEHEIKRLKRAGTSTLPILSRNQFHFRY